MVSKGTICVLLITVLISIDNLKPTIMLFPFLYKPTCTFIILQTVEILLENKADVNAQKVGNCNAKFKGWNE